MGLTGFRAANHPQQTGVRGARDAIDDRGTDPEMFAMLDRHFRFDLDVAASLRNAKCERFYTMADDGLTGPWSGSVWCNPPYSNLAGWVQHAWEEWRLPYATSIVMLVPSSRTEQAWWQDHVEPFRDQPDSPLSVVFLRNRRRFVKAGTDAIGPNERPPFGSCLLVWSIDPLPLTLRAELAQPPGDHKRTIGHPGGDATRSAP